MPPFDAVRLTYGALIETTPPADTEIGATPVTAPPPEDVTQVGQVKLPLTAFRTTGADAATANVPVPAMVGKKSEPEPAAACGTIDTVPLEDPPKLREPPTEPGTPRSGLVVNAGGVPARTEPAAPTIETCPVTGLIRRGADA